MVFSSAAEEARLEEQPLFVYLHNHFLVFYSFFFASSWNFGVLLVIWVRCLLSLCSDIWNWIIPRVYFSCDYVRLELLVWNALGFRFQSLHEEYFGETIILARTWSKRTVVCCLINCRRGPIRQFIIGGRNILAPFKVPSLLLLDFFFVLAYQN
jgi:hypothetical protein